MPSKRLVLTQLLSVIFVAMSTRAALGADLTGEQVAARRQLIEQAQSSRATGDYARALELAARAGELEMSVSLRRFIAEVQFEVGDPAAALGSAELCERDARAASASEHADACASVASSAREHVGFVVVRLSPEVQGARVELAGREVPRLLWGERYVVKPGAITATATAADHEAATATVEVARGEVVELALTLKPKPRTGPVALEPPTYELSVLVPIGASVAVAGFAVALGVGLSAVTALSDYEDRCTKAGAPRGCEAEQQSLQDDLDLRAIGVNVAFGTAALGLVVGTVGLLLSGTPDETQAALWQGKVLF